MATYSGTYSSECDFTETAVPGYLYYSCAFTAATDTCSVVYDDPARTATPCSVRLAGSRVTGSATGFAGPRGVGALTCWPRNDVLHGPNGTLEYRIGADAPITAPAQVDVDADKIEVYGRDLPGGGSLDGWFPFSCALSRHTNLPGFTGRLVVYA